MNKMINTEMLFSDRSDRYVVARPTYPPELFEYLANLCESHDSAWDCATGSGQAARSLIPYFSAVKATDVSDAQLQNAVQHEQIQYSVQRAEKTCFGTHEFDLITVAQALHWFDLPKFWKEVDRVLKPGGILAVWGYNWLDITPEIDQKLQDALYLKIRPYWASENKILWDGYNTIDFPFPLLSTPSFSLELSWNLDQLFMYLQTWSAVRRCIAVKGQGFIAEAKRDVGKLWRSANQERTVTMELFLKVSQAAHRSKTRQKNN